MEKQYNLKLRHLLLMGVIILTIIFCSSRVSFEAGKKNGINTGIIITLDTINTLLEKQIKKKDTSVSQVIIQSTDTSKYILSPKTIKITKTYEN